VRTLVVLPTYNEAANIDDVLRQVRATLPAADVLVVDDGSPDGTADLADALGAELGRVEVLRRPGKRGLGDAYRTGFQWGLAAGYEVLVEMDADLSHDPGMLSALVGAIDLGADLTIGSRYVPGGSTPDWRRRRRFLSTWGNIYAAMLLGLGINDATSGFRAYRATILREIDLPSVRADGYGFQIEMAYRVVKAGGRVIEVPIRFLDRERGASKMSGGIVREAFGLVTVWGVRDLFTGRRWRRGRG
jgi:glycosyltransferase involved in cell wall biosynthesis